MAGIESWKFRYSLSDSWLIDALRISTSSSNRAALAADTLSPLLNLIKPDTTTSPIPTVSGLLGGSDPETPIPKVVGSDLALAGGAGTGLAEAIRPSIQDTMEKYKEVIYIGSGNFGEVWLVENKKTRELFAMKRIQRGQKIDKYVAREIINQKSLRHPNVIQFKEVVLSSTYLGIVMEHAKGGQLHDKIFTNSSKKGLDENMARYYFKQLIFGVFHCHSQEICHRDLKPDNILLDGSEPPCLKICDFGFSKSYRLHSKPKSAVGTPQYSAPEVCSREYDGKSADLWSCGAILYTMLVGEHPNYRPNDTGETSNVYETNACPFSLPDSLSPDSKDLLARMLLVDPRKRIPIEDVKKHRWFTRKLKGKLAGAFHVTKENPRFSFQSDEEIEIIVDEAKIPPPEDANGTEEDVESEEEE